MAEDFNTDWTEQDTPNKLSQTDTMAYFGNMIRNEICYLYRVISTGLVFRHNFRMTLHNIDVNADASNNLLACFYALTENIGRPLNAEVGQCVSLWAREEGNSTTQYRLYLRDTNGVQTDTGTLLDVGTEYFPTIIRNGDVITVHVYDDAIRTSLVDTLTITLLPANNIVFSVMEVTCSADEVADGNDQSDGEVRDLDLDPIPNPCLVGQWINGDFELGAFTYWNTVGSPTVESGGIVRSGTYWCKFNSNGDAVYYDFAHIPVDDIEECYIHVYGEYSFSPAWASRRRITIYYLDGTSTIINHITTEPNAGEWEQIDLLSYMTSGKSVSRIRIERTDADPLWNGLDCCIINFTEGVEKIWHVKVNGIEWNEWVTIEFEKRHPSNTPDTFSVVFNGDKTGTINYFDRIAIYKEQPDETWVLKFYGYVEEIDVGADESGVVTSVAGRCRKVIIWKKFTERFSHPKLKGFFSKVYPHQLFKFLLYCPVSDIPTDDEAWESRDFARCKIGWGMNPLYWTCTASSSAIATSPEYTTLRLEEFYWRNRGINSAEVSLTADGVSHTPAPTWTDSGGCANEGCIDAEKDGFHIETASNNRESKHYTFDDLPANATGINWVKLRVRCRADWLFTWGTTVKVRTDIWDTAIGAWRSVGALTYKCKYIVADKPWHYLDYDITYLLDTVSQVNGVKVRFVRTQGDTAVTISIDYVLIKADYSQDGSQKVGDTFQIDLGDDKSRVSGIVVQSRQQSDQYPRHYRIQTATQDYLGQLGNTAFDGNQWISPSVLGSMVLVGPWTVPADTTIDNVWAYLNVHEDDANKEMVGVVYREVVEDYTTYDERDPNAHISFVGTNHVDFDAYKNEVAHISEDYGAVYFTRFIHELDFKVVSSNDLAGNICGCIWALCNTAPSAGNSLAELEAGAHNVCSLSVYRTLGAGNYRLRANTSWVGGSETDNGSFNLVLGTMYYLRIVRPSPWMNAAKTIPNSNEEYMGIYLYPTAGDRDACTNELDFFVLSHLDAIHYRYIYGALTYQSGAALHTDFDLENLKLYSRYELIGETEPIPVDSGEKFTPFYFLDPIEVSNGDRIFLGYGYSNTFTHNVGMLNYNGGGNVSRPWISKTGVNNNPPNPYGTHNTFSCGNYPCIYLNYGGDWTTVETVSDNCAQDLVHSWYPRTVQYIKIVITQDYLSASWSISQVYVYQADTLDYCIIDEGGSYQYLDEGTISPKSTCSDVLKPLNIPYARMIDNLEKIATVTHTGWIPWEWWITLTDAATADINFGASKGSDKSATVRFRATTELGGTRRTRKIKQSAQRVRITGGKQGKRQDEVTSNWKEDSGAMATINTFYEDVRSDRTITDRETASEYADLYKNLLKDPETELLVNVEAFPDDETWDVGDTVNIYDPKTQIADGNYRVNACRYRINASAGEKLVLVITSALKYIDVTDKLTEISRRIKVMELSNIDSEEWAQEAKKKTSISAEKLDNLWNISRKYEETTELTDIEMDPSNQDTYTIVNDGVNGQDIKIRKDNLTITGNNVAINGNPPCSSLGFIRAYTKQNYTSWDRDPRFKTRLMISVAFPCDDDEYLFGIGAPTNPISTRGFGYRIVYDSGQYVCYAWAKDGTGYTQREVAILATGQMYEFEARAEWDERYVFFYIDGLPKAVIEVSDLDETTDMALMYVCLYTYLYHSAPAAKIEHYSWETQVKIVEPSLHS